MSTTTTGPANGEQVWMADIEQAGPVRGGTAHRYATRYRTGCGISTRNGVSMPAGQAADRHGAGWCPVCWPTG